MFTVLRLIRRGTGQDRGQRRQQLLWSSSATQWPLSGMMTPCTLSHRIKQFLVARA
jgi:hypothetical protein